MKHRDINQSKYWFHLLSVEVPYDAEFGLFTFMFYIATRRQEMYREIYILHTCIVIVLLIKAFVTLPLLLPLG